MNSFKFVGKCIVNDITSKNPYIKGEDGKWKKASFAIEKDTTRAFCSVVGFKNDVIKTYDTDNNAIEIPFDEAMEQENIDKVANYRKKRFNIDGETETFISEYLAAEWIEVNIDLLKNNKIIVTGDVEENVYNGKVYDDFVIKNIYSAKDDDKEQLKVTSDVYLTKDSLDTSCFKDDKKLWFDVYIKSFIRKCLPDGKGANRYIPKRFCLDLSKINWENERMCKVLDFKLKCIGVKRDGQTFKSTLKSNKVYAQKIELVYVNGAEEVDFDESMLTDLQKESIELGLKTIDDFKPKGNVYGDRITTYKITNFPMDREYEDGIITLDDTIDEFEDEILNISTMGESSDKRSDNDSSESDSSSSDIDEMSDEDFESLFE